MSGDRAHYFTSATELRAIWECYSDRNSTIVKSLNSHNTAHNTDKDNNSTETHND